jgi:hypothetical protein
MDACGRPSEGKVVQAEKDNAKQIPLRAVQTPCFEGRWGGADLFPVHACSILQLLAPSKETRLCSNRYRAVPLLLPQIKGAVRRDAVVVDRIPC